MFYSTRSFDVKLIVFIVCQHFMFIFIIVIFILPFIIMLWLWYYKVGENQYYKCYDAIVKANLMMTLRSKD